MINNEYFALGNQISKHLGETGKTDASSLCSCFQFQLSSPPCIGTGKGDRSGASKHGKYTYRSGFLNYTRVCTVPTSINE